MHDYTQSSLQLLLPRNVYKCEVKTERQGVRQAIFSCLYKSDSRLLQSEKWLAADWHELMIPQRTMRSSVVRASEILDIQCS